MKKQFLYIFLFLGSAIVLGQVPNISYNTPNSYTLGTDITPLNPNNTGGIVRQTIYGQVSTMAGKAPTFYMPFGVAVDAAGHVYVADQIGNNIKKITATGVVTILAGGVRTGSADGTGTAASFNKPSGVAVDASGNVYVADYNNNKIRKITAEGVVTTLAGSGTSGSADATGTAASFNQPSGVAVDVAGNVYVADSYNNRIRKVTGDGIVTTLAGSSTQGSVDGIGAAASFHRPTGVAMDLAGNLYIADSYNDKIRKITATGVVSTLAGSGVQGSVDGTGTMARFRNPTGVTVDSGGSVYVADMYNNKIRKITALGVVTTFAGNSFTGSADGTGTAASFNQPTGIAVDAGGTMYVADLFNKKIRKITGTAVVTTFAGNGTIGSSDGTGTAANFKSPLGLAVDNSDNLYVTSGAKIRKINAAGIVTTLAGNETPGSADGTGAAASFFDPYGVAVDVVGNVYVADRNNSLIRKITAAGVVTTLAGSGTNGTIDGTGTAASFSFPKGVALDLAGNLYVGEGYKIRKINVDGVVTTFAGGGAGSSTDGTATAASFNFITAVAVDVAGNVYVADAGNHKIRKISAAGVVTTLAGSGTTGSADGIGIAASFNNPSAVAVDLGGNVYVADTYNNRIRKITADGVVTTLAGSGFIDSGDGTGIAASFYQPYGVAVDSGGNVYVADTSNYTIRKITIASYVISPSLTTGLIFDNVTGGISGTPMAVSGPINYTVTAYNASGSSSTKVNITVGNLSASSFELSNNLKIYPNPASSTITIELKNLNNANIEVIDSTGKKVMKQNLNITYNSINIEKLPSGIYIFRVNSDQGSATSKVVKN